MKEESRHISDDVLIQFLANELPPQEAQQIQAWISTSKENQRYFNELAKTWSLVGEVGEVDFGKIDAAWQRLEGRITEAPAVLLRPMWRKRLLQIAAVFFLGILSAVAISTLLNRQLDQANTQLVNETNRPLKQELADGSIIHLKQGASLTYPNEFQENRRIVRLTGEAFFEIEKDSKRPFVIETEQAEIEVLGTSFLIKAIPDAASTEVIVKTGTVVFRSKSTTQNERIILQKGDAATLIHDAKEIRSIDSLAEEPDIWVPKLFRFSRTPLAEVVAELGAAFEVEIDFTAIDGSVCRLTGTYESASIEEILMLISASNEYTYQSTNTGYVIQGNNCTP